MTPIEIINTIVDQFSWSSNFILLILEDEDIVRLLCYKRKYFISNAWKEQLGSLTGIWSELISMLLLTVLRPSEWELTRLGFLKVLELLTFSNQEEGILELSLP